ncbi:MAG: hypothetical protein MUO53_16440 [Maribacter sp.]|nr:hypothetical protein [Maribacter sp.]
MPLDLESFKNNPPFEFSQNLTIPGLDSFANVLEKDFFSKTTLYRCKAGHPTIHLVIELKCDLSMAEMLFHFIKGDWGCFKSSKSSLTDALSILQEANTCPIEIDELSLILKDTTIVIDRIYENSIPQQLKRILTEVGNHYVHITRGLHEIPYEIYLPVFEEKRNSINLPDPVLDYPVVDYFGFWGLYFESEEDALVYDLDNLIIIPGDLYMLNH